MKLQEAFSKLNNLHLILFLILVAGFSLRVFGLGYSHYYGDETKALYLDKTVPAYRHLLDQRKGPAQFVTAWTMEKITGGYDEFSTRLPFALAGVASVLVFYLVVQQLFGDRTALISTGLFSLNGFYIAFSRTVQYQSLLVLFGLLAIYFALQYFSTQSRSRKHYAVLAAGFLAAAHLSHYDAVFFDVVVGFLLLKKAFKDRKAFKELALYFVVPFVAIIALFYIPYFMYGFYSSNTANYIAKRFAGFAYQPNASWYTYWVYNPHIIWPLLNVFLLPVLFKNSGWRRNMIWLWFLVPFVAFQLLFSNPGTHIHNYVIPLIILVSLGIVDVYEALQSDFQKSVFYAVTMYVFATLFLVSAFAFIPKINTGYPFALSNRFATKFPIVEKKYQLFLYGFPYNRGWDQIRDYAKAHPEVHKVYTNDNDTIAHYYLRGVDYTRPGANYIPKYYIHVANNQEYSKTDAAILESYDVEKEFVVDGEVTAIMYKLKEKQKGLR